MNNLDKMMTFFAISVLCVVTLSPALARTIPDGKLHLVFCDVGQGDAIYLRLPDGKDVLIDGGPNNKILTCLGKYMSFFDRTIEIMVLTHPHEDHFNGLIEVLKRYKVSNIVVPMVGNSESDSYSSFAKLVQEESAPIKNLYQSEKIEFRVKNNNLSNNNDLVFTSLWPPKKWVADNIDQVLKTNVLSVKSTYNDLNDFSQILHLSFGSLDVLFTGDAEVEILEKVRDSNLLPKDSIEIIKVPHQGNKNALTEELVSLLKPQLGVIMVGKNSFGHPSPQTIQLLSNQGVMVKRTDQDGTIEIVSDGKSWSISNSTK